MTRIRIGLEYLHKKGTFTKLYCLNVNDYFLCSSRMYLYFRIIHIRKFLKTNIQNICNKGTGA